jgi:integrase
MAERRITVWVQRFNDRATLMLQWLDPDTGRRKSKSAGTAKEGEAEQARSDLEYELNHGKYQEASKLDWEHFRDMFEAEYLPGLRSRTQEKYRTVLDVFEEIVHPKSLRSITERTISLFVKGMRERDPLACKRKKKRRSIRPRQRTPARVGKTGLAPTTIKNYLVSLKNVLGWAVSQKLLPAVPTFPTIKVPKKKPQPIAAESFEKLLEKAPDPLWRAYLQCGWYGGLRLSEASHLRWEPSEEFPWVDFEGNRILLPAVFVKAAEDQWVPLHSILRQALAELPRTGPLVFPFRSRKGGGRLSRNGITNRVLAMAKQAGVKLSMHRLRKGFGCRVAKQLGKGNAPILHELMRHSSMQVTMDYYASVDDVKQDAINSLT